MACAVILVFLASIQTLYACSCPAPDKALNKQVAQAYGESAAIFSGRVMNAELIDESTFRVTLKVAKVWKGKISGVITIITAKESSMCGYPFETGEKYIVYANGTQDELRTDNCSRTALAGANRDLRYLDTLKKRARSKTKGNK
jgi:hypothetical protein